MALRSMVESEVEEVTHRVALVYTSACRAGSEFGVAADLTGHHLSCYQTMTGDLLEVEEDMENLELIFPPIIKVS
ncbi:hypothetical protein E2C01_014071 [Portunus trituberculatus]|uniref:Uncharacterized protein n=1 Tax=Portunus trituberculatus TaxID=210409 RepID=A0A5B7DI70_PORTR|nr:hypothetical protein [Portunus trituberculatus]